MKLPHVTWLRAFEAAARHRSFSAAADELGLTPAAVSQQIRLLEKHIDAPLFERLPRGVSLTELGQAYALPVRKSFSDISIATNGLFDRSNQKTVKVRASISCAALVIAPKLAEFRAMHPDIAVELSTFVWADHFGEEESDIDIRYGQGDWKDGKVIHLANEFSIPVCHPDYAARFGKKLTIQNLAASKIVKITGSELSWARLSDQYELALEPPAEWLWADSSLIALQTVITGEGAVMVLESFARQYILQGLLTAPFEYRLPVIPSHYLIQREGRENREEVQLFSKWVTSLYQK